MYKLNDVDMFYDIADGQAVVINFATGAYYGTNPLGSEILDRLLKGYATEKILAALKKAAGCPADIETLFNGFIDKLKEFNILAEGETVEGGDGELDPALYATNFKMTVTEYKEVQDLILADPIHEVKEDAGWPNLKEQK